MNLQERNAPVEKYLPDIRNLAARVRDQFTLEHQYTLGEDPVWGTNTDELASEGLLWLAGALNRRRGKVYWSDVKPGMQSHMRRFLSKHHDN